MIQMCLYAPYLFLTSSLVHSSLEAILLFVLLLFSAGSFVRSLAAMFFPHLAEGALLLKVFMAP